mgnify:CR=1 FL=1
MKIQKLTLANFQISSNCYILSKDSEAVVIDPGIEDQTLYNYLQQNNLNVTNIVLTHGHFDHWGGLKKLQSLYPNAKLYASTLDYLWYEVGPNNMYNYEPNFDFDLNKLNEITLLGYKFKVLKLPGHSAGSIGLYYNNYLFSGDVLFFQGIGRTDLLQGDYNTLINSINKIYQLPDDTIVYSGHGRPTTVKHEKQFNPFFRK